MKRAEPLELRLYRSLLRFYPEKFQREYGDEMLRTFRDTLQDATTEGRLPSFWLESLVDAISSLRRERRAARTGKPMMNRYDERSRLIFHHAREEQFRLEHSDFVHPEHILLGLVRDPAMYAALNGFGVTLEMIRDRITRLKLKQEASWSGGVPHIAEETRHLMKLAAKTARARQDSGVYPSHMLLAILEQPASLAFQVLTSFATPEQIRSAIGTPTDSG